MTFEAIDSVEFRETESHMVHEKKCMFFESPYLNGTTLNKKHSSESYRVGNAL